MTVGAAPLRALSTGLLATLLCACSSLPFLSNDKKDADAKPSEPEVKLYDLDIEAPSPLPTLLQQYLDLARFQNAPKSEAISGPELERLVAAAPAQARALLETEGYFDADVKITQGPGSNGLPHLVMHVAPGPRVVVKSVSIAASAPLAPRSASRDEPWSDRLEKLRQTWTLKAGQPFRQPAWAGAKNNALNRLRADGYPTATWADTQARIDATAGTAALDVTIDGGPLFRLGAVRIEGANRYDEATVRRLRHLFRRRDLHREDAARLPGSAGQDRPLRRRVGGARCDRAARRGPGEHQGEGAEPAPSHLRHRL